jgi:transposase-like protein
MSKEREPASGATEGARRATGETPEERRDGRGRWSAKRKFVAVLRLLRGEDLETLARQLGVTAVTLSGWRDQFLEGGAAKVRMGVLGTCSSHCKNAVSPACAAFTRVFRSLSLAV